MRLDRRACDLRTIYLSEGEISNLTVEIPGELKLSNPVPPPIAVSLPIVTCPSGPKTFWLACSRFRLAFCSPSHSSPCSLAHGALVSRELGTLVLVVMLSLSLLVGVIFMGLAFTCFAYAVRAAPALEISAEGLHDGRSGFSIAWWNVLRAEIFSGGVGFVDLTLRGAAARRHNPFQSEFSSLAICPKPGHVIVSTDALDVPAHVLVYTILTLVRQHGGEAVSVPST